MSIARELVTLLTFRVNAMQLAEAERRIQTSALNLASIGRNMTLFASLPTALLGRAFVKSASEVELLRMSLEAYLGSAGKAVAMQGKLYAFAKESPLFTVQEIGEQAKSLLGRGFLPEDVIPSLKKLGDVAAGVGVELWRIVQNYTQVRAAGKLTGKEMLDFARAGVPLLDELARMTGMQVGQVRDAMRRGQISFKMVEQAFTNMTSKGGLFYKYSDKMASTLFGRWQKFKDTMYLAMAGFGRQMYPFLKAVLGAFEKLVGFAGSLNHNTKRFSVILMGLVVAGGPLLMLLGIIRKIKLTTLAWLAAIYAIALLLDEIYVWTHGGESYLGDWLGPYSEWKKKDHMEILRTFVTDAKDLLRSLGDLIRDVEGLFKKLFIDDPNTTGWERFKDVLKSIRDILNSIFLLTTDSARLALNPIIGLINAIAGTKIPTAGSIRNPTEQEQVDRILEQVKNNMPSTPAELALWRSQQAALQIPMSPLKFSIENNVTVHNAKGLDENKIAMIMDEKTNESMQQYIRKVQQTYRENE